MTSHDVVDRLAQFLAENEAQLPQAARAMSEAITARHGGAVVATVFYGSALREADNPDKMLDFYVIVDRYSEIYRNPLIRVLTWALPPGVHYLQTEREDGRTLRSKYAVVSRKAFHRRTSRGLESMLWARFVQPVIIHPSEPEVHGEITRALAKACLHFYREAAPLVDDPQDAHSVWVRGLAESYRTELRPENPSSRAQEIVDRYADRYQKLNEIITTGETAEPTAFARAICKGKWLLRRIIGKPRGAARVLKAAVTFDGGLDYVLEKVGSHSGVEIEVSDRARKHPFAYAPVIAWRLYRAGAFR